MSQRDLSEAKNPDLRASLAGMLRAAESARQTALQTGTAIVVVRDGKPVRITASPSERMSLPVAGSVSRFSRLKSLKPRPAAVPAAP